LCFTLRQTMSQNLPASSTSTALEDALDKNEVIQETVEQSAAELCLINAVLKHEVPDHVQTGEVAQALQKTDELESRIQSSAEDLAQVNHALKQEISARAELERQLASTQAALDRIQSPGQGENRSCAKSAVQ
jgi:C4-dicarboxylate-specific signal transduction histidine kinase